MEKIQQPLFIFNECVKITVKGELEGVKTTRDINAYVCSICMIISTGLIPKILYRYGLVKAEVKRENLDALALWYREEWEINKG